MILSVPVSNLTETGPIITYNFLFPLHTLILFFTHTQPLFGIYSLKNLTGPIITYNFQFPLHTLILFFTHTQPLFGIYSLKNLTGPIITYNFQFPLHTLILFFTHTQPLFEFTHSRIYLCPLYQSNIVYCFNIIFSQVLLFLGTHQIRVSLNQLRIQCILFMKYIPSSNLLFAVIR